MDIQRRKLLRLAAITASALVLPSCGDGDSADGDPYAETKSDLNSISIRFKEAIDPSTISKSSVSISDDSGQLNDYVIISHAYHEDGGSVLTLTLQGGLSFKHMYFYQITITPDLKNTSGIRIYSASQTHEVITGAIHPHQYGLREEQNQYVSAQGADPHYLAQSTRNTYWFISDLHLNIQDPSTSATDSYYGWMKKDGYSRLLGFLSDLRKNAIAAELVILGDLLDNWVYPHYVEPKPPDEHFEMVIKANPEVVNAINYIANDKQIKVTYVHGNHDMQLSKAVFNKYFPNVNFVDSNDGLYVPGGDENMICEHGHRYDFMCAPVLPKLTSDESKVPPITIPSLIYPFYIEAKPILPGGASTMLPLGYYNSRMVLDSQQKSCTTSDATKIGEIITATSLPAGLVDPVTWSAVNTAWGIMVNRAKFSECTQIKLWDGYTVEAGLVPCMYWKSASEISWITREKELGVKNPLSSVALIGLLSSVGDHCDWGKNHGACDPYQIAAFFLATHQGPTICLEHSSMHNVYPGHEPTRRIAVAGHTHIPTVELYNNDPEHPSYLSFVYANSGTWSGSATDNCSFVVITRTQDSNNGNIYNINVRQWISTEEKSKTMDPLYRYNGPTGQAERTQNPVLLS